MASVRSLTRELLVQIPIFVLVLSFFLSLAALVAYGGSQAKGRIGAAASTLHQSHSNMGSELHLRPTPQLMAMPDP